MKSAGGPGTIIALARNVPIFIFQKGLCLAVIRATMGLNSAYGEVA